MSMRRHRNKIHALFDSQGQYIYDQNSIKETAIDYYQQLFNRDTNTCYPQIETRMQIIAKGREYLSSLLSMEEIKTTLFSINDSKSPGPDGFSFKFYKLHWDTMQFHMYEAISEFFHTKKLPLGVNHNFITLIP